MNQSSTMKTSRAISFKQLESVRKIIIIRHGKPALSRKVWLNWKEYRKWWKDYDKGGLAESQQIPEALKVLMQTTEYIFSSSMNRSYETANLLNQKDLNIEKKTLFIEAALPPPHLPDWVKMKPGYWGVIARICWCFGWSDQMESQKQARIRAQKTAELLVQTTQSYQQIALTAHGWFNRMVKSALLKTGCECVYECGDGHWSWRVYHVKPVLQQNRNSTEPILSDESC